MEVEGSGEVMMGDAPSPNFFSEIKKVKKVSKTGVTASMRNVQVAEEEDDEEEVVPWWWCVVVVDSIDGPYEAKGCVIY